MITFAFYQAYTSSQFTFQLWLYMISIYWCASFLITSVCLKPEETAKPSLSRYQRHVVRLLTSWLTSQNHRLLSLIITTRELLTSKWSKRVREHTTFTQSYWIDSSFIFTLLWRMDYKYTFNFYTAKILLIIKSFCLLWFLKVLSKIYTSDVTLFQPVSNTNPFRNHRTRPVVALESRNVTVENAWNESIYVGNLVYYKKKTFRIQ